LQNISANNLFSSLVSAARLPEVLESVGKGTSLYKTLLTLEITSGRNILDTCTQQSFAYFLSYPTP
jgi:hypothetical protein